MSPLQCSCLACSDLPQPLRKVVFGNDAFAFSLVWKQKGCQLANQLIQSGPKGPCTRRRRAWSLGGWVGLRTSSSCRRVQVHSPLSKIHIQLMPGTAYLRATLPSCLSSSGTIARKVRSRVKAAQIGTTPSTESRKNSNFHISLEDISPIDSMKHCSDKLAILCCWRRTAFPLGLTLWALDDSHLGYNDKKPVRGRFFDVIVDLREHAHCFSEFHHYRFFKSVFPRLFTRKLLLVLTRILFSRPFRRRVSFHSTSGSHFRIKFVFPTEESCQPANKPVLIFDRFLRTL